MNELIQRIDIYIEKHIRPSLRAHQGDLEVIDIEDGKLILRLLGQCSNCPASQSTVSNLIEAKLLPEFSEIESIKVSYTTDASLIALASKILNKDRP